MNRTTLWGVGAVLWGVLLWPVTGQGAKRAAREPDRSNSPDVTRVLRAEVAGSVDRRQALEGALKESPTLASARWQSGFVKQGNDWVSFDAVSSGSAWDSFLADYRDRRANAPQTFEGQLELANWCRRQKLIDQEQSHLYAAVALDTQRDHPELLRRLGYRRVGSTWLAPEQLREWGDLNRQAAAALKEWGPKLERIARQLSGKPAQQNVGRAALREIKSLDAIPAVELALSGRNEEAGLAAVELFERMPGHQSSLALARQGVFSRWPSVRDQAAASLKNRTYEDFIPQLISLLATPIKSELRMVQLPWQSGARSNQGALFYSQVLSRETDDQFQVTTINTINSLVDDGVSQTVSTRRMVRGGAAQFEDLDEASQSSLRLGQIDARRAMGDRLRLRERGVDELNAQTEELNGRVGAVLASATGQAPSADAKTWWNWWGSYNDAAPKAKRTVRTESYEVLGSTQPTSASVPQGECFAAGTPVWTEAGLQAIEQVQPGDRVLSQDVETGELTYKTVLHTTVQPPKELQTLRLDAETIVCTSGHRFWISGLGWMRAKDLEPAWLVHTTVGNTPVWSAGRGETAATYNLVVADFHTYFVGKTGVLSHDVLVPKPTNKLVPGLDRSEVASRDR
ncbi:MAG: polymorphic toxin-type HINT domain-containing protein [Planctomycetales bacterium]